jgi:hypothetical protein
MSENSQRYISKDLVHFIGRGKKESEQFELLINILKMKWLMHYPFNLNDVGNVYLNKQGKISDNEMFNPQMICFADIPIKDLSIHMSKYGKFGLAFSKQFVSNNGGTPVHYIPENSNITTDYIVDKGNPPKIKEIKEHKSEYYNKMFAEFHELFDKFESLVMEENKRSNNGDLIFRVVNLNFFFISQVFSFFKFFNPTKADYDIDNYYFEREWRVIGQINFSLTDIKTIFLPEKYAQRFRTEFPNYYGQLIFT